MKKIILAVFLVFASICSFSQGIVGKHFWQFPDNIPTLDDSVDWNEHGYYQRTTWRNVFNLFQSNYDSRYFKLSGGTLTGSLILAADPTTALGAATKQYVDNKTWTWSSITATPNTLSGYGITDAYTKTASDARYLQSSNNLSDVLSASTARSNLGLVIGTNIEAWSAKLDNFSSLANGSGALTNNGSGTYSWVQYMLGSNNLSEITSASTARANLGLTIGTNVQAYSSNLTSWSSIVPVTTTSGTYNNVTVNSNGFVTAGSNVSYLTGNQTITISGDGSGSGTTSIPLTVSKINGSTVTATTNQGVVTTSLSATSQVFKTQSGAENTATASGTNTYTASLTPAITSYASGLSVNIVFTNANTGASTINLNGLGAKSIVKNGSSALTGGEISAGQAVSLIYDGTNFQLSAGGGGTSYTFSSPLVNTSGTVSIPQANASTNGYISSSNWGKFNNSSSSQWITTSSTGAVSDADLSVNSTTFGTDNTTVLQNLLNTASASNPLYILWDGRYSCTGLTLKSYTYIFCLPNCGAILRTNSNTSIFITNNLSVTSINTTNITIDGGIWNANNFTSGGTPNQVAQFIGTLSSTPTSCITAFGCNYLTVKNCELRQSPHFSLWAANCNYITLDNVISDHYLPTSIGSHGYDGFHINGPATYITINNCIVRNANDDCFAISADDNASSSTFTTLYGAVLGGDINYVNINNIRSLSTNTLNGGFGLAIRSSSHLVDNVFIDKCSFVGSTYWLTIDAIAPGGTPGYAGNGNIGSVTINNIEAKITLDPQALLDSTYALVNCNIDNLTINNYKRIDWTQTNFNCLKFKSLASVNRFTFDNWYLNNNTTPSANMLATPFIEVDYGAYIKNIVGSNSYFNNNYPTVAAPAIQIKGYVKNLDLDQVTFGDKIRYGVNYVQGYLGSIRATNINHLNSNPSGGTFFLQGNAIQDIYLAGYQGFYPLASGSSYPLSVRGEGFITNSPPTFGIYDDFNRTNGSLVNAVQPNATYQLFNLATFSITTQQVLSCTNANSGANHPYVGYVNGGYANGVLSADITYSPTNTFNGLAFRIADINNYMYVQVEDITSGTGSGTNTISLVKKVSGTATTVATTTVSNSVSTIYNIRVAFNGTTILVYNNGTQVLSYTTSTGLESNTNHGFLWFKGGTAPVDAGDSYIDNLIFTPIISTTNAPGVNTNIYPVPGTGNATASNVVIYGSVPGSSGTTQQSTAAVCTLSTSGITDNYTHTSPNFYTTSSAPSITAGAGAGTGPTITWATGATNKGGVLTIATGTSPTSASTIATLTFSGSFNYQNNPQVTVTANDDATSAAISAGTIRVYGNGNSTSTALIKGTLAASTTYTFNVSIGQ